MARLIVDVQHAVRGLARNRGFTATAVLTLALGIGANAAVFTATWHLLLKPLPWPAADRLVQVWNTVRRTGDINVLAPANSSRYRTRGAVVRGGGGVHVLRLSAQRDRRRRSDRSARTRSPRADRRLLSRVRHAARPRTHAHAARRRGGRAGHRDWRRPLGFGSSAAGRTLSAARWSSTIWRFEVVGVMPASIDPSSRPLDGWVPYHFTSELAERRLGYFLGAVARLSAGVSVAQANADVSAIATAAGARYPASNQNIGATARSLRDELTGSLRSGLILLAGCAAMVLLIACSNLTSLHVARTGGLGREIAIRTALGATRGQIVRLLMLEAGLVSGAAGIAGLVAGLWIVRAIVSVAPPTLVLAKSGVSIPVSRRRRSPSRWPAASSSRSSPRCQPRACRAQMPSAAEVLPAVADGFAARSSRRKSPWRPRCW